MRSGARRRGALAALMAALVLAGCASVGGVAQPEDPLTAETFQTRLAAAQQQAGSVHVAGSIEADETVVTFDLDLAWDAEGRVAARETLEISGQSAEVVYVDDVFYVRADATGGVWASVDPADASNPLGESAATVQESIEQADPAALAGVAQDAIVSLRVAGASATLDGVETTPYVLVANASDVLGATAAAVLGVTSVTYNVWVGDDDLPRRALTILAGTRTDVRFTGWNTPVSITAPEIGAS